MPHADMSARSGLNSQSDYFVYIIIIAILARLKSTHTFELVNATLTFELVNATLTFELVNATLTFELVRSAPLMRV